MRLHEIFQSDQAVNDTETSLQDFIITQFEQGEISYEQAREQLKKLPEAWFWLIELGSAQDLKDPTEFDMSEKRRVDQVAQRHAQSVNASIRKQ